MNKNRVIKYIAAVFFGFMWGGISLCWAAFCMTILAVSLESYGSYDFEYEGLYMLGIGAIGVLLYLMSLCLIYVLLRKRKDLMYTFILAALLCGIGSFYFLSVSL